MTTNPPRSLSPFDSRGRRVLRLPNGTGTYICVGSKPWAGDGDPLEYMGWEWEEGHDPTQADLTDLTDDEIREICRASADKIEGVIARIAASRKAADPPAEAAAPSLRAQGLGAREPTWGSALEDLRKAREYLDRAIARMTAE